MLRRAWAITMVQVDHFLRNFIERSGSVLNERQLLETAGCIVVLCIVALRTWLGV